MEIIEHCERCSKLPNLCICNAITPVKNKIFTMILQHPQEPDKDLGTAKIATLSLSKSALRVGLSWPNMSAALTGAQAPLSSSPKHWGVLYLGSARAEKQVAEMKSEKPAILVALDRKGNVRADSDEALGGLAGIIILDGTWSQAKTLWWRNAWLLKMHRLALFPRRASLYGKLRREPRRECLSTIETAAYALAALEEREDHIAPLLAPFMQLLEASKPPRRGQAASQIAAAPVATPLDLPVIG